MPNKDAVTLTPVSIKEGNVERMVGFRLSANLMFSDFNDEREGKAWAQPLRARGNKETGKLAGQVVKGKWVQPEDYRTHEPLSMVTIVEGEPVNAPLYVLEDGTLTTEPYEIGANGTRGPVKPFIVLEERKATFHRDFAASMIPANIKWPDGKVRKLRLTIKANNPLDEAEYKAKVSEKVQRMQASTLKKAQTVEDLDKLIEDAKKRKLELAGAK